MNSLPSDDKHQDSSQAGPFFTKQRIITWAIIAIILTVAVYFVLGELWDTRARSIAETIRHGSSSY